MPIHRVMPGSPASPLLTPEVTELVPLFHPPQQIIFSWLNIQLATSHQPFCKLQPGSTAGDTVTAKAAEVCLAATLFYT